MLQVQTQSVSQEWAGFADFLKTLWAFGYHQTKISERAEPFTLKRGQRVVIAGGRLSEHIITFEGYTHFGNAEVILRSGAKAVFAPESVTPDPNYPDLCPDCHLPCSLEGEAKCYECLHAPETEGDTCDLCGGDKCEGTHWIQTDVDNWTCRRNRILN